VEERLLKPGSSTKECGFVEERSLELGSSTKECGSVEERLLKPGSSAKKGGFVDEIEVLSEGAGDTVKEKRTPLKYVGL